MAAINVTLTATQTYDPLNYDVFAGDTVTFHNGSGRESVICIVDPRVFGGTRFYIPLGGKLTLVVQDSAPTIEKPAEAGAIKRVECTLNYFNIDDPADPGVPPRRDQISAVLDGGCQENAGSDIPGPIVNPPE